MEKQEELLEETCNFVHIVENGIRIYDADEYQIFDTVKFNRLEGTTFSTSTPFLSRLIAAFDFVELIVGISNREYQENIHNSISLETAKNQIIETVYEQSGQRLFRDTNPENREKIMNGQAILWAPTLGITIHSKFYLMWNEETGRNRVVIGSANLSTQAFSNKVRQFEEVLVFDDSPYFEIYKKRFEELKPFVTEHIPNSIKKEYEQRGHPTIFNLSDKTVGAITADALALQIDQAIALGNSHLIDVNLPEMMESSKLSYLKELEEKKERERGIYEIIPKIIGRQDKKAIFKKKNPEALRKIIGQIVVHKSDSEHEVLLSRPKLARMDEGAELGNYEGHIIKLEKEGDVESAIAYSEFATKEQIKESLHNIHEMMQSYQDNLQECKEKDLSRVYEAILYTFTSPFISHIRARLGSVEDVPIFCFLGGAAGSGKTSLLRYLCRLTNEQHDKPFIDYPDLKGNDKRVAKNNLEDLFREDNVYPIMLDEMEEKFFSDREFGEKVIVEASNTIQKKGDKYPTLIGTTNSKTFSMEDRAGRRSYYLKINTPFDKQKKAQSLEAYNRILTAANTDLFKDFICRYYQLIVERPQEIVGFHDNGKQFDFMKGTREIFIGYYEMIGESLPNYFPDNRYDDLDEKKKQLWQDLFCFYWNDEKMFQYNAKEEKISFAPNHLNEGNFVKYGPTTSRAYLDSLPSTVGEQVENSYNIVIDAQSLFKWLEIENPYTVPKDSAPTKESDKIGFFQRLFRSGRSKPD